MARPREEASEVPGAAEKLGATVWAPCYARAMASARWLSKNRGRGDRKKIMKTVFFENMDLGPI